MNKSKPMKGPLALTSQPDRVFLDSALRPFPFPNQSPPRAHFELIGGPSLSCCLSCTHSSVEALLFFSGPLQSHFVHQQVISSLSYIRSSLFLLLLSGGSSVSPPFTASHVTMSSRERYCASYPIGQGGNYNGWFFKG